MSKLDPATQQKIHNAAAATATTESNQQPPVNKKNNKTAILDTKIPTNSQKAKAVPKRKITTDTKSKESKTKTVKVPKLTKKKQQELFENFYLEAGYPANDAKKLAKIARN